MTKEQYLSNGSLFNHVERLDHLLLSRDRNGNDLGIAFENIPCGKGIAYFPAISLSQNERVQINFGALPFRHPTANYRPIDDKPRIFIEQSEYLLNILEQIIHLGQYPSNHGSFRSTSSFRVRVESNHFFIDPFPFVSIEQSRTVSDAKNNTTLMIIAQYIMERLSPLLVRIDFD